MPETVDFAMSNLGSLWYLTPLNEPAMFHADIIFLPDAWSGEGVVIEHRYALDIVDNLVNEHHFTVSIDGRVVASITPK